MRVVTRAVYEFGENWYDWVLVAENTRLHVGPVVYCKGPSNEMKDISSRSAELNKTLIGNYSTQFANQQAVFNAIRSVYDPIMKAGPGQFGFTHDEESALRTSASESTARNYRQAGKAVSEQLAARGGGNSFLPSGAEAQIQGEIAGAAAESESQKQLGVTEAGYDVGRQQFRDASNIEMGVAAGYNPLGYADAASKSGDSAFGMASKIREMQNASSPWGLIGGLAGGVLGAAAGSFGTKLGSKLGGFLGNAGSGNSGGDPSICWIAQALYGHTDPRVTSIRSYLLGDFINTWLGSKLVKLYKRYGQRAAKSKLVLMVMRPIFNLLLRAARKRGL